jgi:hypothetical protein
VPCSANANGICTPTEALFVAHDIANGNATAGGEGTDGCLACLVGNDCIDDVLFGDTNAECGDLTGTMPTGAQAGVAESTLCLNTAACILQSSCASQDEASCYCGSAQGNSACQTGGAANGPCLHQEADGLGLAANDPADVLFHYRDLLRASGTANQIFECALLAKCSTCLADGNAANCPRSVSVTAGSLELGVAGSTTLRAFAQAPDPAAVTFSWSAPAGTISNTTQTATQTAPPFDQFAATATFTCPPAGGDIPVTVAVDGSSLADGGTCPASQAALANAHVTVTCRAPVDAGPPTDAGGGPDAGDVGDGSFGPCDGSSALVPCTAPGQSCCVPCSASAGGICTQTEALIVAYDIAKGRATAAGESPNSCYSCLAFNSCLDDITYGDMNQECDEMTGVVDAGARAGTADSVLCLDTVSCILASSCAAHSVAVCYCGTHSLTNGCSGNPPPVPDDGACVTAISNGMGLPRDDATDILGAFTDQARPAGRADQIFACAHIAPCTSCWQ